MHYRNRLDLVFFSHRFDMEKKRQHNNKSTDPKKYINAYTNSTTVNIQMKRKVYSQVDMVMGIQTQSNNNT